MIKKLIEKIAHWQSVRNLEHPHDVSEDKKMKAYAYLYQNVDMMKILENLLIQDTKEMMAKDWKNDGTASVRYGLFTRARDIKNNAEYYYKEFMRTK